MIIGLRGPAGVGKTTLALALAAHNGFETQSFADPLKRAIKILGFSKLQDPDAHRTACIMLGAYVCRTHNPNFFIDFAEANLDLGGHTVFDDVRYPNERQWILDQGGLVFYLTRDNFKPDLSNTCPSLLRRVVNDIVADYVESEDKHFDWNPGDPEYFNKTPGKDPVLDVTDVARARLQLLEHLP